MSQQLAVPRKIQFPPMEDKTKLVTLLNHINDYMDGDLEPKEVVIIQVETSRPDIAAILSKIAGVKITKNGKGA